MTTLDQAALLALWPALKTWPGKPAPESSAEAADQGLIDATPPDADGMIVDAGGTYIGDSPA